MFQVYFKPLPRFWVRSIQGLPNSIKPFLIFWILFPNSPNIHRLTIHDIFNPRKLIVCLIMNLPINSSPSFYKENKVFYKKTFSKLVFGDDFASIGIIWMYHDFFYVLGTKFKLKSRLFFRISFLSRSGVIWVVSPWHLS